MIEVIGGKLYQWDIGRKVKVIPAEGFQVHKLNFANDKTSESLKIDIEENEGFVTGRIPDSLLKKSQNISCYAVMVNSEGERTIEEQSFNVYARNKPEDYELNANRELLEILDDIIGESVGDTIYEKLDYLKSCIEILHQTPEIKYMREALGENKTLKELAKNISNKYQDVSKLMLGDSFEYTEDFDRSGYYLSGEMFFPNGESADSYSSFKAPETNFISGENANMPFTITKINPKGNKIYELGNISLIDFRNVKGSHPDDLHSRFDQYDNGYSISFKCLAKNIEGIYLPKTSCFQSVESAFIQTTGNPYFINGIHIGSVMVNCYSEWLFYKEQVNVLGMIETPVYCDKDFVGDVYLEKLNIPLKCLVDLFNNLAPLTGIRHDDKYVDYEYDYSGMVFSIGSYNMKKVTDAIYNRNEDVKNAYENALQKGWDIQ